MRNTTIALVLMVSLMSCDLGRDTEDLVTLKLSEVGADGSERELADVFLSIDDAVSIENSYKKTFRIEGESMGLSTWFYIDARSLPDEQFEKYHAAVVYLIEQEGEQPEVRVHTLWIRPDTRNGMIGRAIDCGEDNVCAGTIRAFVVKSESNPNLVLPTRELEAEIWADDELVDGFTFSHGEHGIEVPMTFIHGEEVVFGNVPSFDGVVPSHHLVIEAQADDRNVVPLYLYAWYWGDENYSYSGFPGELNGIQLEDVATKENPLTLPRTSTFVKISLFAIRLPES